VLRAQFSLHAQGRIHGDRALPIQAARLDPACGHTGIQAHGGGREAAIGEGDIPQMQLQTGRIECHRALSTSSRKAILAPSTSSAASFSARRLNLLRYGMVGLLLWCLSQPLLKHPIALGATGQQHPGLVQQQAPHRGTLFGQHDQGIRHLKAPQFGHGRLARIRNTCPAQAGIVLGGAGQYQIVE
jgi:hypothetical protein